MKSASEWSAEHFNLNEQTVRAIQADAAADMRERCLAILEDEARWRRWPEQDPVGPEDYAEAIRALPLEES